MTRNTALAALIVLAGWSSAPAGHAATIHRCTQADGRITLSDSACPPDTVAREYQGETTSGKSTGKAAKDPWSVMEQVRRLEKREGAEHKATSTQARRGRKTDGAKAAAAAPDPTPEAPRKLSYQEARRKALEDTGYSDDARLSKAQRERVAEELAKYGHTLREPAKKSKAGKGKKKKKGDGETTGPDGGGTIDSAAPDSRNGSLIHNPR